MKKIPYPKSFPNTDEEKFLRLVLSNDTDFLQQWNEWKSSTVLDDVNYATVRLFPYLYLRMESLGLQDDDLFGRIKGTYKTAWVKNQRLLAVTKDVIQQCTEKNIPILILKGIPLLLDVYQDRGARFLGDADFIIPPEHAPGMVNMMLTHGWHYDKLWTPDTNNPTESIYRVVKSTTLENDHGVQMDVHWNLFALNHHANLMNIFTLGKLSSIKFREAFWKSAVPSGIDDVVSKRLCNEDLLIHVLIHGSEGNHYRPLRWVVDAITIIRTLPIDWEFMLDRARNFGFHIELSVGFRYLKETFYVTIPDSFMNELTSIPVTKKEIRTYYRFANISHSDRYKPFGNFPLIWYAYWNYEPKPRTITRFYTYVLRSFGLKSTKDLISFIFKKYKMRVRKLIT